MNRTAALEDRFGRRFSYLRLSVTDVCNFRCDYCLPDGYQKTHAECFLSVAEIRRLVTAFARMGVWKVRLTGGEPTVRPDFCDLARAVADVPSIGKVAFTTNGYRLPERARDYYAAGLRAINVSIDSLDPRRFHEITGHDRLDEVVDGVQAALEAGFDSVKINTVLLKGLNDDELDKFVDFVRERPVSLRFIELMQTGDNLAYFRRYHVAATVVKEKLLARGWRLLAREEGAGPAIEYEHPLSKGKIGLIAPYAKDFCATCNRLRVSALGHLHLCLFGAGGFDLRPWLQDDGQMEAVGSRVQEVLTLKKVSHFLQDGQTGTRSHLASIGG